MKKKYRVPTNEEAQRIYHLAMAYDVLLNAEMDVHDPKENAHIHAVRNRLITSLVITCAELKIKD